MRFACIAIFFFFLSQAFAQAGSDSAKIITDIGLKGDAYTFWHTNYDQWRTSNFYDCLKQAGVKMSCAHCTSVYLNVDLVIDEKGKVTSYKKIKSVMCGSEMKSSMEKCFINYFLKLDFPAEFHGKTFRIQIGNGLKC